MLRRRCDKHVTGIGYYRDMGNQSRGAASVSSPTPIIHLAGARRPSVGAGDDVMIDAGAGWYYDPTDQAVYRYWNGLSWTEHSSDLFPTTPPSDN